MDATVIGAGLVGLIIGIVAGRWSARKSPTRVVWSPPVPAWPPDEEIEQLVQAGRKIHAIKRHRDLYGSTLRQAKEAIDAVEARPPGGH